MLIRMGIYTFMEYIEGQSPSEYLRRRGPLPLPEALEITRQVAEALDYAHNFNPPAIHRDIKPANLLISGRAIVTDFGIARVSGTGDITRTGIVMGTPRGIALQNKACRTGS